jgi:alanyl-tRNA synthetase
VVLAENPFYATGGGQVADEGWITSERGQLEVFDVVPAGGYQVLRARVERDGFAVGDAVTASINRVRRQQIEANHTATHILHWALRAELGQDVVQAAATSGPTGSASTTASAGGWAEEQVRRVQEQCLLKITRTSRYATSPRRSKRPASSAR